MAELTLSDLVEISNDQSRQSLEQKRESEAQQRRRYSEMVHGLFTQTKRFASADEVFTELNKCGKTAEDLKRDVELLHNRVYWKKEVDEANVEELKRQRLERFESAKAALFEAKKLFEQAEKRYADDLNEINEAQFKSDNAKHWLNDTRDKIIPTTDELDRLERGEKLERPVYGHQVIIGPGGTKTVKPL